MPQTGKSNVNISLILFLMIFAITFVSIFTYVPIYTNTVEQKTQQLKDEAQLQAILLRKIFRPATTAPTQWSKERAQENALKEVDSLWQQLSKERPEQEYFLVYKNPQDGVLELKFATKTNGALQEKLRLIKPTMYMSIMGHQGVQSITDYSERTIHAAYATVIKDEWGIVIKYNQQDITPAFVDTAHYTIFAALLITLISWLIFRLTLKNFANRKASSAERYHELLDNSLDWIWETDKEGKITYSSPQVQKILGYEANEIIEQPFANFFDAEEAKTAALVWQQKFMLSEAFTNLEISFVNKSGTKVHLLLNGHPILDKHEQLTGFRGIARDISELKQREGKMLNMAFFDPLTKLANRPHFIDKLRRHLNLQTPANALKPSALLFIDLDGFKEINDTEGHDIGDQLLTIIAKRMLSHARKSDLVARLGGDEFVVLISHHEKCLPPEFIKRMDSYISRLIATIREPINIDNRTLTVEASIGVAIIPRDGNTVSDVLNHADTAMYEAKAKGKNTYQYYDYTTQAAADHRLKTSAELRQAIENDEFELYYQFQHDIHTHKVIGMEALLRWHHPETHKTMSAQEFLETAEGTNNIQAIDEWVINAVAKDIARMNKETFTTPPVSINLSTREIEAYSLPNLIEDSIKRNFISPKSLTIEITESSLIHDLEKSSKTIKSLKDLGVKICIDNFGTGYSSLSYLQALPIESLKIDKSFVDNIATSHSDLQMCRTIIQLGKSLQLQVIAEGVQATVQRDILQKEGCHLSQGYLFSQPEPLSKVIAYFNDNPLAIKS